MGHKRLAVVIVVTLLQVANGYRLITFDLDDTFWPIAPVVASANSKLCEAFDRCGVAGVTPWDVQSTMKRLRPELEAKRAGVPPTYTYLRTAAIARLLSDGGLPQQDVSSKAEELFGVWLSGRHEAAEASLFTGAVTALTRVRAAYPDATIAALTNGRGDPCAMSDRMARCFDFTVSGEEPSIHPNRKPSPVIFRAALERAGVPSDSYSLERSVPARESWVHVGDDLLNDVAAAKELGALTVWLDLAAEGSAPGNAPEPSTAGGPLDGATAAAAGEATYSTLDPLERARREAKREAVPSWYIDQRIEAIAELPAALDALAASRV